MSAYSMITTTPEQTKQIAADLAKTLQGGELILLEGDLGAGKTTFVQGLAAVLGVTESVRSPTFTIMQLYKIALGPLVHVDFYRLLDENIHDLGLDENVGKPSPIVVAEGAPRRLPLPSPF